MEEDNDGGTKDLQWFAMHFLVVRYRDMIKEQDRTKCVIREVIITKLTTEVSTRAYYPNMYVPIRSYFCVVGGS